ncbi:MAG: HNH endonuclease [Ignavibacteriaceae bacterium]
MFSTLLIPAVACLIEDKRNQPARPITFQIKANGCYECNSHRIDRDGYRKLEREYKQWQMHRYVWTLFYGEIPKGMEVMHKCHNPACMNIDHLAIGTHKQNMEDKKSNPRPNKVSVKLTIEQKEEIAKSEGKTYPQLAAEFNVSHRTIVVIKRNYKNYEYGIKAAA